MLSTFVTVTPQPERKNRAAIRKNEIFFFIPKSPLSQINFDYAPKSSYFFATRSKVSLIYGVAIRRNTNVEIP